MQAGHSTDDFAGWGAAGESVERSGSGAVHAEHVFVVARARLRTADSVAGTMVLTAGAN